jgi:hypothetical protein
LSIWSPVHLGTDELGHRVDVTLAERNIVIGGEPGGGKSVALQLIVAHGALSANCRLSFAQAPPPASSMGDEGAAKHMQVRSGDPQITRFTQAPRATAACWASRAPRPLRRMSAR